MARVRCYHAGVTDLARDLNTVAREGRRGMIRVTRESVREGANIARMLAFHSANRHHPGAGHGKHYWRAITPEMRLPTNGEWGPEIDKKQGDMSFEEGSRNQPPHLDMLRSADLEVPKWEKRVSDMVDGLFWRG